jgi:hypothetical protein
MASFTPIAKLLATSRVKSLIVDDIDDSQLSFLFTHDLLKHNNYPLFKHEKPVDNPILKKIFYQVKHKTGCICCADRVRAMCGLSDITGSILQCTRDCDGYTKVATAAASLSNGKITGVLLLQDPTVMGHVPTVGGYDHITIPIYPSDITTSTDHARILLIKDGIEQYVMSYKFDTFVRRLISVGDVVAQITSCLDNRSVSIGCVSELKILPAIKWCMAILHDLKLKAKAWDDFTPKEKIGFGIYHIIRADLVKGCGKISDARLFTAADFVICEIRVKSDKWMAKYPIIKMCVEKLTS